MAMHVGHVADPFCGLDFLSLARSCPCTWTSVVTAVATGKSANASGSNMGSACSGIPKLTSIPPQKSAPLPEVDGGKE